MTEDSDQTRAEAPNEAPPRRRGLFAEFHELLAQIAIPLATALAVWLFLRDQVLDAYEVPTASMEPTIEGDRERGDRVIVDKTFDERTRPDRFGLVVFWLEEAQQIVVKRVAGLPGECIEIRDGDLFVGPNPSSLERVVKHLPDDADLFARYWDQRDDPEGLASSRWWRAEDVRIEDESWVIPGTASGRDLLRKKAPRNRRRSHWSCEFLGKVTTGYLDAFGRLQERSYPASDFGIDVVAELAPGARLWLRIDKWGESFTLCVGTGGFLAAFRRGRPLDLGEFQMPELASAAHRLRAMWLDGGLALSVDDRQVLRLEPGTRPDRHARANGLALAASAGAVRLRELRVIRDLHYLERGSIASFSPAVIPPQHYFLLGDNSEDSRDSRYFGPLHEQWLRGRPLLIAAPLSRFQVFRR